MSAINRYAKRMPLNNPPRTSASLGFTKNLPGTPIRGDIHKLQGDIFEWGFMYYFLLDFEASLKKQGLTFTGTSNAAYFKKILDQAYNSAEQLQSKMAENVTQRRKNVKGIDDFFAKILGLARQSAQEIIAKYGIKKIKNIEINPGTKGAEMAMGDIFLFINEGGQSKRIILELKMYASPYDIGWVTSNDKIIFGPHASKMLNYANLTGGGSVSQAPFWHYANQTHWHLRGAGAQGRATDAEWNAHIEQTARQSFFAKVYAQNAPDLYQMYHDLLGKGEHQIQHDKILVVGHARKTGGDAIYNTLIVDQHAYAEAVEAAGGKIEVKHNRNETKFLIDGRAAIIASLNLDRYKVQAMGRTKDVVLKRTPHTVQAQLKVSQAYLNYAAEKAFS